MSQEHESVRLPPGMRLWCWQVRNGACVQRGETLALLVNQEHDSRDEESTENDTVGIKEQSELELSTISATGSFHGASVRGTSSHGSHKRPTKKAKSTVAAANTNSNTGYSISVSSVATAPTSDHVDLSEPSTTHLSSVSKTPLLAPQDGILTIRSITDISDASIVGHIAPCRHETVIDAMCAICGARTHQIQTEPLNGDTDNQHTTERPMERLTVGGGVTVAISQAEGRRIAQQDAQRLRQQRKLSLVLDLDHTLVHATADPRAKDCVSIYTDVRSLVLPLVNENTQQTFWMHHYVKLRPYLKEFLQEAMEMYEVGVYTAGTRQYAEEIAMILARHLAGASLDFPDVERLKYDIAQAEQRLQNRNIEHSRKIKWETSGEPSVVAESNEEEPVPKRRRVMFTEPISDELKDTVTNLTIDQIEEMKKQLKEAQELEQTALDIRQKLFAQRIVSRTDVSDLGSDTKSLKRIFPCGGAMAIVIDDREDVWANAGDVQVSRKGEPPENLLLVRPYHWSKFSGFADVNNASGEDLSGLPDSSEDAKVHRETDEQLMWTLDILKRIYTRYYSLPENKWEQTTLPDIVKAMRGEVLLGARVVLSGLVPLHRQNSDDLSRPRPHAIRYAENLGAKILPQVYPMTTHVVAVRDGTDKILSARKLGCFIVKPSWLMECLWTLTRRDEIDHLLDEIPRSSMSQKQALMSSRDPASSSSDDDDDDDDFAAEFENELLEK